MDNGNVIKEVLIKNKKVVGAIAVGALKAGVGFYLVKKGKQDFSQGAKGIGNIVEAVVEGLKENIKGA